MPETKRDNRRFQRGAFGSAGGTYTCCVCKKSTRETGKGESDYQVCANCLDRTYRENDHNDNGHSAPVANCPECERKAVA